MVSTRPAPAIRWRSHCFMPLRPPASRGTVSSTISPKSARKASTPIPKMMATFHARGGGFRIAVKGAPEAVLDVRHAGRDRRG